jgi:hypothetical protein
MDASTEKRLVAAVVGLNTAGDCVFNVDGVGLGDAVTFTGESQPQDTE